MPTNDQDEAYAVSNSRGSNESSSAQPVERRQKPREDGDPMDWETKVVQRLERHVKSLTAHPDSPATPLSDLGWEEASVRVLQSRVRARPSD